MRLNSTSSVSSNFLKLSIIGFVAGIILILPLKLMLELTGNTAYVLLFNFDYIPVLNELKPVWLFGCIFHFATSIASVIFLFYILKIRNLQYTILYYVVVYTLGGAALFFLTALSDQPPAATDKIAWLYWTIAHAIFGTAVGLMIKLILKKTLPKSLTSEAE